MPSIPGTINFPASLDDAISLIEANNNASSTLTAGISNSDLSIPVADPAEFSASGFVTLVDDLTSPTKIEIAIYTSKSGANLIVPSGGRGAQGTTAQAFSSGNYVEQRNTARHHTALAAALIAIETKLGTGSDTAASGEFLAGSGAGISGWRALLAADIPDLSATYAAVAHTHTFASLTSKPTTLSGYGITDAQPLDSDLTAIAALSPSNDDIIQRKAGVWTNRTPAQFKTDLALVKADVGLGNVENTALSTWAGSTNITTLGTITSGVWNGTAIANANLANSAITIAGTSVSLGSSISLDAITGLSTTGVVKRTGANTLAIAAVDLSSEVTGDLPFANFVQAGSAGFVGATGAGDYSHRTPAQVTAALDAFVGDSGSGGTKGLVPAPASGDAGKYLKGDGTWATVSGGSPAGSTGDYQINNGGSFDAGVLAQGSTGRLTATPTAASSGVAPYLRIITPADTGQTANTEFPGIVFGGNSSGATVTRTGADGTTLATQREYIFTAPTYAFAGATTVTDAATVAITGAPTAGTNATLTRKLGLWVQGGTLYTPHVLIGNSTQGLTTELIVGVSNGAGLGDVSINGSTYGGITGNTGGFGGGMSIGFNYAGQMALGSTSKILGLIDGVTGVWSIGNSTVTSAQANIIARSASRVAFRVDSLANSTVDLAQFNLNADDTSTVANLATFAANSNGTAAAGFGQSFTYTLESSTTNDQTAAKQSVLWAEATHASRKARAVWEIYDTSAREAFRIEASGSAPMIGFLGATAVVRQTVAAAATDAATTQTLANDLRTALINLGLCA